MVRSGKIFGMGIMVVLKDVMTVLSHMCKAYRELEVSHARKEKLERQEQKRRERKSGAIDVEFRIIK